MGLCQKITAERVLADQIFVIADEILNCDLPFAAAEGASISGTLDVTLTELDFVTIHKDDSHKDDSHKDDSDKYDIPKYDSPKDHPDKDDPDKDNALQITITLMYQKELTVTGNKSARPPFAPPGLPLVFPLEYKIEKAYKQTFCGITKRDIRELGVKLSNVRAELVRIVRRRSWWRS